MKVPKSLFAAVLTVAAACGSQGVGGGASGGPPPATPPPPPVPADQGALLTSVGLDAMGYKVPDIAPCLKRGEHRLPAFAAQAFQVDGQPTEWASIPATIGEPAGDADAAHDLTQVAAAASGDDLALFVGLQPSADTSLEIDLGGLVSQRGAMAASILRYFRLYRGVLEERRDGVWGVVPSDLGKMAAGPDGSEVWLSRRLVGEAMSFPLWSISVRTRDGALITDSAPVAYFPSWLDGDRPRYAAALCTGWYTRPSGVDVLELNDVGVAGEQITSLARLAVDTVETVFHAEPPPVAQMAVLATYSGVDERADQDPYAVTSVNISPFSPTSPNPFPVGPVFRRLAARLFDLYLLKIHPAADPALRAAVRNALLDHVVRDSFGLSYFFDTYRATLGDASVAWGHVLGGMLTNDQLIDAWRQLAVGASTHDVFGEVTAESSLALVGDQDRDGLPDHYEAVYGTDPKRDDSDGDGWSDLAEVVTREDPLAHTRQPSNIMPDANFDDWLTLFPQKVHVDEGSSSTCPVAADINFYAAIATPNELVIGAVAHEFWENEPRAFWEAVIDLPAAKKQFLISVPSDSYATTVRDPATGAVLLTIERAFPQGRKTVEWVLRRSELKLTETFDTPDTVRIRIRTLFHGADDKDIYCDETAWFPPYVNR